MYTESTKTSTRSKIALAASVASAPPNDASLLRFLGDFALDALQRGFALFDEFQVDAMVVQFGLHGGDRFVGFVDDFGEVARERPHLIGDRVGQQEADARQREEECEVYGEHREPARNARAVQRRPQPD